MLSHRWLLHLYRGASGLLLLLIYFNLYKRNRTDCQGVTDVPKGLATHDISLDAVHTRDTTLRDLPILLLTRRAGEWGLGTFSSVPVATAWGYLAPPWLHLLLVALSLGPFHSSAFPCSFCCKRNFCFELSCLEKCLRPAMPPPRGIERQGPFEGFFPKATSTGPHEPIPVLFATVFVSVWIFLLVSATSGASVEERPVYVSRAGKAFSRCRWKLKSS